MRFYLICFAFGLICKQFDTNSTNGTLMNGNECLSPIVAQRIKGHPLVQPLNYEMLKMEAINSSNKTFSMTICYFGNMFVLKPHRIVSCEFNAFSCSEN